MEPRWRPGESRSAAERSLIWQLLASSFDLEHCFYLLRRAVLKPHIVNGACQALGVKRYRIGAGYRVRFVHRHGDQVTGYIEHLDQRMAAVGDVSDIGGIRKRVGVVE